MKNKNLWRSKYLELVKDLKAYQALTPTPPKVYGYIRVSTAEQAKFGLSLASQEEVCRQYHRDKLPGAEWGALISDEGQSASKKLLFRREKGRRLPVILRKGDHLIVPIFDRAFRSMFDFVNTMPVFKEMGVIVYFLDAPFDMTTAFGNLAIQMRCSFAEFESRIIGERVKAAHKMRGVDSIRGMVPARKTGYKVIGTGRSRDACYRANEGRGGSG
jgi:putative DNA-invertase from lambdoid prophage Rac